jgi:hypothetical protein
LISIIAWCNVRALWLLVAELYAHDVDRPGRIAATYWITLLASALLLTSAAAQSPVGRPVPALVIAPLTGMAFAGPHGGPFSPSVFQYRLSATGGTVNYSIRTPSWLTVSSALGAADTSGVTITLTVNATAFRLPPGSYGPGVAFTNVTNGQGSATRTATLHVRSTGPLPDNRGGYLLDGRGGGLLDDRGGRLLAQ